MPESYFDHMPASYDIEGVQGDDILVPLAFKSGTPLIAIDLTDYTFDAKIKTSAGDVVLTVYVPTPSLGVISIVITKEQSSLLNGSYPWQLDWITPAMNRRTILSGFVRMSKDV